MSSSRRKRVEPIQCALEARPHGPVYRMHRYFARRPPSVFAGLIKHYSNEGDVVLDPFCGGGVTVVEGVIQKRRAIGFDLNPLATFITAMELADVDPDALREAYTEAREAYRPTSDRLFATTCRRCGGKARALWFEHSGVAECAGCSASFVVARARKRGPGTWECPSCGGSVRFAPRSDTPSQLINVLYSCPECGHREIAEASACDRELAAELEAELERAEREGLWVPSQAIPDCNMQRESALFKKGITQFRQLFTPRHLLALGELRRSLLAQDSPLQDWLLFAFSSSLRYTNRMVTRNPGWRGERPLEWAKPGFWLPAVHLESNVLEEFSRRCDAVWRGKRSYLSRVAPGQPAPRGFARDVVVLDSYGYHVSTRSATSLPLEDQSVDVVITDPPYGSYVHYADLSNFWSVWLPEIEGLGGTIESSKEAVIARKSFPGAKSAADYQRLLEQSFRECARVLKRGGYMVLTFHNREPRAWAALLVAAVTAGFDVPPNGVMYQDGVPSYKHTAQARRAGSVIGDFVLSFRKGSARCPGSCGARRDGDGALKRELLTAVRKILTENGPMAPDALVARLYIDLHPYLLRRVKAAVGSGGASVEQLMEDADSIALLDSHRRQLLEQHFSYVNGKWTLRSDP